MNSFKKTIIDVHGEAGRIWWDQLPHFLDQLSEKLHLSVFPPFPDLSCNYVLPVIGPNHANWVLKLNVPNKELSLEIHALRAFNGDGIVQLVDANAEEGWLLIERLHPGKRLADLKNDQQAIPIAIAVMKRLWRKPNEFHEFMPLSKWIKSLHALNMDTRLQHLVPSMLRHFVLARSQELLANMGEQVLLHGDLHHYNILQHGTEWLAIDPTGLVGEREFEIGAFLRNPLCVVEDPLERKAIANNLDLIIEHTGFDKQKVLSWCIVHAVLCCCWYVENKDFKKGRQLGAYAERLYSQVPKV